MAAFGIPRERGSSRKPLDLQHPQTHSGRHVYTTHTDTDTHAHEQAHAYKPMLTHTISHRTSHHCETQHNTAQPSTTHANTQMHTDNSRQRTANNTVQHSTAQHSTAQHSTCLHTKLTAQHSYQNCTHTQMHTHLMSRFMSLMPSTPCWSRSNMRARGQVA
jgi:hypothetical protein